MKCWLCVSTLCHSPFRTKNQTKSKESFLTWRCRQRDMGKRFFPSLLMKYALVTVSYSCNRDLFLLFKYKKEENMVRKYIEKHRMEGKTVEKEYDELSKFVQKELLSFPSMGGFDFLQDAVVSLKGSGCSSVVVCSRPVLKSSWKSWGGAVGS